MQIYALSCSKFFWAVFHPSFHPFQLTLLVNGCILQMDSKLVEMEVLNHAVIYIFRIQQFYIFWQLCELNLWEKAWMIETFLNEQ